MTAKSERHLPPILLVEDETTDANLLQRAFAKAKVLNPVLHLHSGDEALGYLAGVGKYADRGSFALPALILLDLKLPGMTGFQLLQWMRTQRQIRRIPVVVLTVSADPATVNAAYDLGANSYLVKSANPEQVMRLVQAMQRYWIELNQYPQLIMVAEP